MINETPQQAAQRFSSRKLRDGFKFIALHPYQDADGQPLYWRIRLKNYTTQEKWIRPMHCDINGQFILKEPQLSINKPLYNLPKVLSHQDEAIWVVEGEHCVDKLDQLGLAATTSGSAESVNWTDWSSLKGKKIVIWPDNDKAGLHYALAVTQILHALACEIYWINVEKLGLAKKEDCIDWINKHPHVNKKEIEALPTCDPLIQGMMEPHSDIQPRFSVNEEGVYYHDDEHKRWLCSKLEVKALARDPLSENWGRLLVVKDADNHLHQWAMPMAMLKGSGEEMRGELLRLGLVIAPGTKNKNLLTEYVISSQPQTRARCVSRTGWHNDVFVLPSKTIGNTTEEMIYQSEYQGKGYQQAGTLEQWQKEISHYCQGNSRLVLAVSSAFASMLLYLVGMESGGIHFVGESSSGKTTALRVAASVFGAPDYLNRWRATTNGIEGLAMMHNDTLLVLDELAQVDPKEAGEMAYMLANGTGKIRAHKSGTAKMRGQWRLLFLSAGEVGLSQHMRECGKKSKAGQEVRLVDMPADAEANLGLFETLHNFESGALLSNYLLAATTKTYGVAAIAFLETMTSPTKLSLLPQKIKKHCQQFISENLPSHAGGQVYRICERFALIAVAGEIASHYGITGWPAREAKSAAITCFKAWLEKRGSTCNQKRLSLLSQVRAFFETHGESRFSDWKDDHSRTSLGRDLKNRRMARRNFMFYQNALKMKSVLA